MLPRPVDSGVMSISWGATRGFNLKFCKMVVRKMKSSMMARPSPRHSRFPAGGEKWEGARNGRGLSRQARGTGRGRRHSCPGQPAPATCREGHEGVVPLEAPALVQEVGGVEGVRILELRWVELRGAEQGDDVEVLEREGGMSQ